MFLQELKDMWLILRLSRKFRFRRKARFRTVSVEVKKVEYEPNGPVESNNQ